MKDRELLHRSRSELAVYSFDWSEILSTSVKRKYEAVGAASSDWLHWLTRILKRCEPHPPDGYKWNALCVYMNARNIEYLHERIDAFIWLDTAPVECDELDDHEYGIHLESVLEKNRL